MSAQSIYGPAPVDEWAIVTASGKLVDDHGTDMTFDTPEMANLRFNQSYLRAHFEQTYGEPVSVKRVRFTGMFSERVMEILGE